MILVANSHHDKGRNKELGAKLTDNFQNHAVFILGKRPL